MEEAARPLAMSYTPNELLLRGSTKSAQHGMITWKSLVATAAIAGGVGFAVGFATSPTVLMATVEPHGGAEESHGKAEGATQRAAVTVISSYGPGKLIVNFRSFPKNI